MNKLIYFFLFLFSCFLMVSFSPKFKPNFSIRTVVIDAGHGGKDPGCHGKKYKEKDVALAVALKLGDFIERNLKDVEVIYTRKTDVFIELQERANIANKAKADLFICIHCNSACYRDKKLKRDVCKDYVHGAETYVMGLKNEKGKLDVAKRENSAILLEDDYVQKYDGFDPNSDESYIIMSMFTDTYLNQSLSFASKLQNQYTTKGGRKNKGVKRASLWVLWRTFMPSVLTEIGYLTNPEEEKFLGSIKGQEYIAACIFRAFRSYKDEMDGVVKKYDDAFENMQNVTPIVDAIATDEDKENETIADSLNDEANDTEKTIKNETKIEKIVEKPKVVEKEKPIEKTPEKTPVVIAKKPIEEKVIPEVVKEKQSEKVIAKTAEQLKKDSSAIKKPIEEKPKETIDEKVVEKSIEKKEENITAIVVERPIEKPVEKPIEKAVDKTNEKPAMPIVEKPIEKVVEKPKVVDAVKPIEKNSTPSSPIVYKVQIRMSDKKIDLKSDTFKGLEKLGMYMDKNSYKYTVGEFENQKDAIGTLTEMRAKGYNDAFIIKMQDGKRILSK